MNSFRTAILLGTATAALAFGIASPVSANAPPVSAPAEATRPAETLAPIRVSIASQEEGQAVLVIPRELIEQAGFARAEAPAARSDSFAVIATILGGGAMSLGVLLLGIYLVRRTNRRTPTVVAGSAAAIALFGASVVFADLIPGRPLGPIPDRDERAVQAKPDQPQVKFIIAEEGDTIELTLPRTFLPKK